MKPGQQATLDLLRDGKPRRLNVQVGTQPQVEPAEAETEIGFHVQEITRNLARDERLAVDRGAFVSFVARGSAASEAGLEIGDVIERIEDREVENLDDFRVASREAMRLERFLIVARRGAEKMYLLVKRGAPRSPPPRTGGRPGSRRRSRTEPAPPRAERRSRQPPNASAPSAARTRNTGGRRPLRRSKPSPSRAATSSAASGATACSVQPPNPAPVRREPYTPGSASAISQSASSSGVLTSKSSRRLRMLSRSSAPAASIRPAASCSQNASTRAFSRITWRARRNETGSSRRSSAARSSGPRSRSARAPGGARPAAAAAWKARRHSATRSP